MLQILLCPCSQLFDRLHLWFIWDTKSYPKYNYVKSVGLKTVHLFTAVQAFFLVLIYVLTRIDGVSVVFPFIIGALVFVRPLLASCFNPEDLKSLDS